MHRNTTNLVHLLPIYFFKLYASVISALLSLVVIPVVAGYRRCGAVASLNAAHNHLFTADGRPIKTVPSLSFDAPLNRGLTEHIRTLELSGLSKEVALQIAVEDNVKRQVSGANRRLVKR